MSDEPTSINHDSFDQYLSLEKQIQETNSARNFRREVEREYRAEIKELRAEREAQRILIEKQASRIDHLEQEFQYYRESNARPLEAAKTLAETSATTRKAVGILIAILMLIGGILSSLEALKKWLSH